MKHRYGYLGQSKSRGGVDVADRFAMPSDIVVNGSFNEEFLKTLSDVGTMVSNSGDEMIVIKNGRWGSLYRGDNTGNILFQYEYGSSENNDNTLKFGPSHTGGMAFDKMTRTVVIIDTKFSKEELMQFLKKLALLLDTQELSRGQRVDLNLL